MSSRLRAAAPGVVSYRLARKRVVDAVQRGHRDREEVCDAHPELRRVADNHAFPMSEPCPICDGDELVVVTFAFGAGLPRGGRCVASTRELHQLKRRGRPTRGYRVEVCRTCGWNHLRESFPITDGTERRLLG